MLAFVLTRPTTAQPHYGEHLGDVDYWRPYVVSALSRHDLPTDSIEAPFVGSFPTFLAGDVVVKLFGDAFDGAGSYAAEHAMYEVLAGHPRIPAPGLIATGALFDDPGWHWPYLISQRIGGVPVREGAGTATMAHQLGVAIAELHTLPVPPAVRVRDLLPKLRSTAVDRLRVFGLPGHLLAEVPEFMADASDDRVLVHADLTADHLFVDSTGLVGIIDWGDALAADRWYEIPAVRFDGLNSDRALFEAFLDGYGWPVDAQFARRALQGVLEFQFNAVAHLPAADSLDELAERLFGK
jgi:hygromycin-B 7''-O-kinase